MAQTSLLALQDQSNYSGPGFYTRKMTITVADFVGMGANATGDILLLNLPAKTVVQKVLTKHSVSVAGAGPVTAATVVVKTSLSSALGGAAFDVFQAVGATVFQEKTPTDAAGAAGAVQNIAAITPLLAGIVLTGGNGSGVSAGSVDITIDYEVEP